MNKEMRQRAARWAKRHIDKPTTPTVRNWTHEDAANHLAQAYLAGARSMDRWHRNKPVYVGDIVDVKVGPLSAASTLVSNGALLAALRAGHAIASTKATPSACTPWATNC